MTSEWVEDFRETFGEPIYPNAINKEPFILAEEKDVIAFIYTLLTSQRREFVERLLAQGKECPNQDCNNQGFTVKQISERHYITQDMALDACEPQMEGQLYSDDEFEQEQCEFCYREPLSKFNIQILIQSLEQGKE